MGCEGKEKTRGKELGSSCLGTRQDSSFKGKEVLSTGPQAFINHLLQIPNPMGLFILARESLQNAALIWPTEHGFPPCSNPSSRAVTALQGRAQSPHSPGAAEGHQGTGVLGSHLSYSPT